MNLIFNGVFGSHLYGLDTEFSDIDFKGVYLPTKTQLVFNLYKDAINTKTEDIDATIFALPKFINLLRKSDIVSFDMIHTPKEFTKESSYLWEELQKLRGDLYCKQMKGVLGYIRTQTAKYGHKIERYNEMLKLLEFLKSNLVKDARLKDIPYSQELKKGYRFISRHSYVENKGNNSNRQFVLDVCGSKYQESSSVDHIISQLQVKIERYGGRTLKGSISGGDWKSMSHAYRVLCQVNEIIDTRDLKFPLKDREKILEVKLGLRSQSNVIDMISDMYDQVIDKLDSSDLPENNNLTRIEDLVMENIL